MWYMITFGPNADPSEPWQRILSQERSAPCKLSARSGLQGLTVTCRILETEIHVESVAFVIGMRRFMYVRAI